MPDRLPPRFAARGLLGAHRAMLLAARRILPADIAAFFATVTFVEARALGTFAELGIADALADGPRTAGEIAAAKGLDADALHRVLRYLAVAGHVRIDRRGRFRLTRTGRIFTSGDRRSMRPWARYITLDSTQRAWAHLSETVRSGEPSFPAVHGRSVWDHFAAHPEEEQLFAAAMRRTTEIDLATVAAAYPWPDSGTIADVAGGVGTLLAGILRSRPAARGVLVDAPGVLREAETHLRQAGVRDRVELREGDIFEHVDAHADVYILKDVLHDWDDARSRTILTTVRGTMPEGSRVVLVENLQERNEPDPVVSMIDLQMLTQCDGGRQRSTDELQALLRDARLDPGEVRLTAGPALVEGVAR
jgi:hypothetical protein